MDSGNSVLIKQMLVNRMDFTSFAGSLPTHNIPHSDPNVKYSFEIHQ